MTDHSSSRRGRAPCLDVGALVDAAFGAIADNPGFDVLLSAISRALAPHLAPALARAMQDAHSARVGAHDAWITVPEVAERLRLSKRTVERHIAAGRLRVCRPCGGRIRLARLSDVERLLDGGDR